MLDRLHDRLDRFVFWLVATWIVFITLPQLDHSTTTTNKHGATVKTFPSKTQLGWCYVDAYGQHYVVTARGHRKIGKQLGEKLIAHWKTHRRKAIARRVLAVTTALTIAACIAVLHIS
jgi:hypothetical protein